MSAEENRLDQEQEAKTYSFRVLPHPIPRQVNDFSPKDIEESDIVLDFPSKHPSSKADKAEREERRRADKMVAIKEHLDQDGVNNAVGQFIEEFNQQPGEKVALGITYSGIVIGIRQGIAGSGDLSAWVIDSTQPPEQILTEEIQVAHLIYDYYSDGGTIDFPGSIWETFRDLARMSEDKRQAILPPELVESFELFQKISSFSIARPNHLEEPSYIHAQPLFGLELQK